MQTVRKLAICVETVDQVADFGVKLNFERSEASIFEAGVEARGDQASFRTVCMSAAPAILA
jgi:hypothetical protein